MPCAGLMGACAVQGKRKRHGKAQAGAGAPLLPNEQSRSTMEQSLRGLRSLHPQTKLKYLSKPRRNFYLVFSLGFTGCLEHSG